MIRDFKEKDVVKGCAANNRRSQEQLYKRYFPVMMQMCMRYTSDRDAAMQIVNNGFLRVFKKIDSFKFEGSLEGWVRRIVFHAISDFFKSEKKYLHFMVFEEKEKSTSKTILDHIYYEDLLKMIEKLPDATGKVFRLYAVEGFKHKEIAELLEISIGTSKWHLSEARKEMKRLIAKYQDQINYAR